TVTLVTILATGVHPLGPRVLLYPLDYYRGAENPSFQSVTEFASPNFHDPLNLVLAAGLISLMLVPASHETGSVTVELLVAVLSLQALVSMRQVGLCALVLSPVLVRRAIARFQFVRTLAPIRLPRIVSGINLVLLGALVVGAAAFAARQTTVQLGRE